MGATLSESIVERIITNLFFRTVFFSGHNIKQHYRKQIFLDRLVLLCLKNMSETLHINTPLADFAKITK